MPKEDLIETKPVDLAKILQEYHDFLKKLNEQEKEFQEIDKEQDSKKIIRFGIILGVSVLSILLLKLIVKKKK